MKVTERVAPLVGALSALATLACCLPLGIAGAIGALGLSMVLASMRPWLIGFALVCLSVGLLQLYRGNRTCKRRSRLSLVLFAVSAAIVLAVIVFPQRMAEIMASLP